jgi:anti-sigma regulatory factor (Ser/Thr protein kinase)
MRSYLELGPLPSAVPCARIHARLVVGEWGLPELASAVELVVSEFVTNALQASVRLDESWFDGRWRPGTPPVRLWLFAQEGQVLVQVWDGNHELPVRQDVDPSGVGGRGLVLVESLSVKWGSYRLAECSGKAVWLVPGAACRSLSALSAGQVVRLPERAREVIECRKSGLCLNHIKGCPLDCAR